MQQQWARTTPSPTGPKVQSPMHAFLPADRNSLRGADYATPEARRNHFATAAAKLAAIPGVGFTEALAG